MLKDSPVSQVALECDWNKVLSLYNSQEERARVSRINRNLMFVSYPLTRSFLNSYFSQSDWKIKSSFNYDCAASMYSYFIMTFGRVEGGGISNFPIATGAGASTGFNPFGGFNLAILPMWLWLMLLAVGGIWVYDKVK